MKQNPFVRWATICSVLLLIPCFMASCAKTRISSIPQTHEPPRQVPGIGDPALEKTIKKPSQPQPEGHSLLGPPQKTAASHSEHHDPKG